MKLLSFRSLNGDINELRPEDLLVAIDETGNENLSDFHYPVFGIGACLCMGSEYFTEVHLPWLEIKKIAGVDANKPLHASDLNPKDTSTIEAIATYFNKSFVGRIAIGISSATKIEVKISNAELLFKMLFHHITASHEEYQYNQVFLLHESSDRLNKLFENEFFNNNIIINGRAHNMIGGIIRKSDAFPPVEIADFITQAHGNQIRTECVGGDKIRKDMQAIFARTKSRYKYNKNITHVGKRGHYDSI